MNAGTGVETENGVLEGRKLRGNIFPRGNMSFRDVTSHKHAFGQSWAVRDFFWQPLQLREYQIQNAGCVSSYLLH